MAVVETMFIIVEYEEHVGPNIVPFLLSKPFIEDEKCAIVGIWHNRILREKKLSHLLSGRN